MMRELAERKKCRIVMIFVVLICLVSVFAALGLYMREYRRNAFEQLSGFCEMVVEDYPEMETAVLSSLKRYYDSSGHVDTGKKSPFILKNECLSDMELAMQDSRFLERYGYCGEEFDRAVPVYLVLVSGAVMVMLVCGFLAVAWYPYQYHRARVAELTAYLGQVNVGEADMVLQRKEDMFSLLQDEIYKTVTELYQTKEQAVAAKANYADHLANIAHQLKTPITSALLSMQLLEKYEDRKEADENSLDKNNNTNRNAIDKNNGADENFAESEGSERHAGIMNYVTRIKQQLERLRKLEETLLTLSKIDAGVLELERREVDVYTVLNLAADNMSDLLLQRNISISIPDRGCVAFWGDMEWTMEALMNLIKNCMEHSGRGGTVYCDYSENLLCTEIRIWDEGTGFAAEEIPHLFERFYCGRKPSKEMSQDDSTEQGIGIGLSLSRSVIELQNGNISARNLPQGGACFEIKIYRH